MKLISFILVGFMSFSAWSMSIQETSSFVKNAGTKKFIKTFYQKAKTKKQTDNEKDFIIENLQKCLERVSVLTGMSGGTSATACINKTAIELLEYRGKIKGKQTKTLIMMIASSVDLLGTVNLGVLDITEAELDIIKTALFGIMGNPKGNNPVKKDEGDFKQFFNTCLNAGLEQSKGQFPDPKKASDAFQANWIVSCASLASMTISVKQDIIDGSTEKSFATDEIPSVFAALQQ